MSDAFLTAVVLGAAFAGGLIGYAARDVGEVVAYWRESRARRRLIDQAEWTPGDDDWLDQWGIRS